MVTVDSSRLRLFACPAIWVLLLGLQGFWLSQQFDAYVLVQSGEVFGWQRSFGYLGAFVRFLIVFVAALVLLINRRLLDYYFRSAADISLQRVLVFVPLQLLCFVALYWLSAGIFDPSAAGQKPGYWYALWALCAALSLVFWLLVWGSPQRWLRFLRLEQRALLVAFAVAAVVMLLASLTQNLWGPLAGATFVLASVSLQLLSPLEVESYPEERLLGVGEFWIDIAPVCSGYEGIGLITAFVALYLFSHRASLRFPQSLWLFPIGAVCIWLLNVVRIVVLMLIGAYWSPEVAVGGFHSFGGWITFVLASLLILWLASRVRLFTGEPAEDHARPAGGINLPMATLIPLVVLLAATMLTQALSAGFDYLYPLRVFAVGAALWLVWRPLRLWQARLTLMPIAAGLAVAALWVLLVGSEDSYNSRFTQALTQMPPGWVTVWLICRIVGAVITVPIAEELAFRGYLLCRLGKSSVALFGPVPMNALAIAASSLAFGLLHGAWLAGTIAGLAYALVRVYGRSIAAPILAHSVTNAALFLVAAYTGNWLLI